MGEVVSFCLSAASAKKCRFQLPQQQLAFGQLPKPWSDARMCRLPIYMLAIALAVSQLATRAAAQADQLLGLWQQIESNAGKCSTCQISIDQRMSALTVTANNGWSATVVASRKGDLIAATGNGRWSSRSKPLADQVFSVEFIARDARLYMTMLVDSGSGRRQIVKGVFGRFWLGS